MRFGIGQADITPASSVELAGYGYTLGRYSTGVHSPLAAYAIAMEDSSGNRAALCGVDLISVGKEAVDKIRVAVAQDLPDGDPAIVINASHTHSGPASRRLHGAGGYNSGYVDNILVPRMSGAIVAAFGNMTDGEIGINRGYADGLSYNRTGSHGLDTRVTALRIDTERTCIAGINFACHPVVLGKRSTLISSDYPGVARRVLGVGTQTDAQIWQTGCAGDVDPLVNRDRKGATIAEDVLDMGVPIGYRAAELHQQALNVTGCLQTALTELHLPVNLDFELNPHEEVEAYRETRKLPRTQDLSGLRGWYDSIAPTVNAFNQEKLVVPMSVIKIGNLAFVGFGAEIYNQTGLELEASHPDLSIVTTMNTNEHQGYVPRSDSYATGDYAARASAYIFGRKPLTSDSENILRRQASAAISSLTSITPLG